MREIDTSALDEMSIQEMNYLQLSFVRRSLRIDFNAACMAHDLTKVAAKRLMEMDDSEVRAVANIGLSVFSLRDQNLVDRKKQYNDVRVSCMFMRAPDASKGTGARQAVFVGR